MRLSAPLLAAVHNTVRVDQRRTEVLLHHPDGIVPWLWEPPLMVAVRICVATQTNDIWGTMACLTDRTPSGKRLHGRRYATIYRRKVLHYNNGCQHSYHLMSFLDGTSTVKNPLHFLLQINIPARPTALLQVSRALVTGAITSPAVILASIPMLLPTFLWGYLWTGFAMSGVLIDGRNLYRLKFVRMYHIALIWYIQAFTSAWHLL